MQMINNQLESILRFTDPPWTNEEKFAFKLGLIYTELAVNYFPNHKHGYPKKGDPRKSELFRICWKLMNDNKNELKMEQFRPFIQAQLSILKNITAGPAKYLFYGPRCLLGKPAWGRWIIWQKHAKAQKTFMSITEAPDCAIDLLKTKTVLENKLRPLNKETLLEIMESGMFFRLARLNAISSVFLDTCPLVRSYLNNHPEIAKKYSVKLNNASKEALLKYQELFGKIIKSG